jgi:para-aminobenzoate synthetase component I
VFLVVIAFGSNHDAPTNLLNGLSALSQQVRVLSVSPVYENPAIGKTSSPPYLNGACLVETHLPPQDLHDQILRPIEDNLGRIRGETGQAQCTLDLDLVLYNKEVPSTSTLQLPAPDILRYAYVAVPLGFLVPDWIHPVTKESMAQIGNRFAHQKVAFHHRVEVNTAIATAIFPSESISSEPIQPWQWRKLPLNQRTGSQVFQTLFLNPKRNTSDDPESLPRDSPPSIATLLESPSTPMNSALARYSICAGAPRSIRGQSQLWMPPVGDILTFLRRLLQAQKPEMATSMVPDLPFTGGWLGWLGYDLAGEIEQIPQHNTDPLPFPTAYWYEPESFAVLDHQQQILWLATTHADQLDVMQGQLAEIDYYSHHQPFLEASQNNSITPIFQLSQEKYIAAVEQAQKYIQAGDIFQANLSLRFSVHTSCDSWSIYQALQHINPSPFASYWQSPWGTIISCSPERLVQLSGSQVQTRPIAGTRSRGTTQFADEQLAQELVGNIKERAEHIMLVDLERNDIGRVCEWGSVRVNELLTIERYSHVMHLVSNVMGTLRPNCDAVDLIRAVFPGGTITGCPKVRCMEIIEELEPVRRNLFYGSCGYLDWRGNLDLNILIRTLLFTTMSDATSDAESLCKASVWGQVGAGIVADSNPEKEWKESLQKAQAQLNALKLAIEHSDNAVKTALHLKA